MTKSPLLHPLPSQLSPHTRPTPSLRSPSPTSLTSVRPSSRTAAPSVSTVAVGGLASASNSSLSSVGSVELEPKPSQSSPETSRRSLSAGRRVLSGEKKRVLSAGDKRTVQTHREKPAPRTDSGREEKHQTRERMGNAAPTPADNRNKTSMIWDSEVAPLLLELDSASSSLEEVSHLYQISDSLWDVLDRRELLGRSGGAGGSKRRSAVLRSVFRLLDHKDPRLLLKLSRIILGVG